MLALALEPSDALVGLLRLKAVIEANRWPGEISRGFRAAIEAEFTRVEETVRTVGLCYADLEESGVAEINRAPQSRFDDIDGALHLCACAAQITLDLDHLRMAFDRGDGPARESAAGLAGSLRTVLWYVVRTDLFVCTRLSLHEREAPPERALEFVEGYFAHAGEAFTVGDPPSPLAETAVGARTADLERTNTFTLEAGALPVMESTAVVEPRDVAGLEGAANAPAAAGASGETTGVRARDGGAPGGGSGASPFAALSEDARFFLFQADIREKDWPVNRATLLAARRAVLRRLHPDQAGPHSADLYASADRGSTELLRLLGMSEPRAPTVSRSGVGSETLQIQPTDLISEDARFFLTQSGTRWPCDAEQLTKAREALVARMAPASAGALGQRWLARVERGFEELKKLAERT